MPTHSIWNSIYLPLKGFILNVSLKNPSFWENDKFWNTSLLGSLREPTTAGVAWLLHWNPDEKEKKRREDSDQT